MDLTCYTYESWQPRIRPASGKRDWMDDTPERFAYRCLPLAIANAHGWEILSPCGFTARWNGGQGVEAVEIMVDEGASHRRLPISLFGQGTITFHVEGILRTSEGWNLWVGGPPNAAKDGIAPLGGVIETDWSPYTFTMNWRFTRPNHWVRFEENEPFCFFFPVQRAALADVQPQLRPIDEAPELKAEFEEWDHSRTSFQKWVEEAKPSAPAEKWQKLYYRGMRPGGKKGVPDHDTKLRLNGFRTVDGTELKTAEICPISGAPGSVLRQQMDAASEAEAVDIALRRREWILEVEERQRALSSRSGGIARVRGLSRDAFLDQYYAPGRPVVIEGEMDDWPALKRWNPEYLRGLVGSAEIEFQGGRTQSTTFELYKDNHCRAMPFDQFIDMITAKGLPNDAYITAYNSRANGTALAPLKQDLGQLDQYLATSEGMAWIGAGGTFTPLHFDLTNNLLAQIIGHKQLILAPPSETKNLYNRQHVFSEVRDLTDPDQLLKYPLAERARTFEVDLGPGDLLYIPVGWWHQVVSFDFSVMFTHTNFLWPNDAHASFPSDQR